MLAQAAGPTSGFANPAAALDPGLRTLAERSFPNGNVTIGVAVHGRTLNQDAVLRRIVDHEFGQIVPANEFKQTLVHPQPDGGWNWQDTDAWVAHAKAQGQVMRIHGPVSPQVSRWMKEDARTSAEIGNMLEAWLPALCGRYAKEPVVKWMDVVNETVDIQGQWMGPKPGVGLADSPWLVLGMTRVGELEVPTYVLRAFELANRHCGNLKLIINQHVITPPAAKRLRELVVALRLRGLRVDGIGWQAHVDVGWEHRPRRMRWLTELIDWAHANGLEFHITESNVYKPESAKTLDLLAQANTFAALLRAVLERREKGPVAWTFWHARDDQTDQAARQGCLWDNQNHPKPAYEAVRQLIASPPPALR